VTAEELEANRVVVIHGREYRIKAGSVVKPEHWPTWNRARLVDSNDDFSTFRIPLRNGGPIESLACEVEFTGKTLRKVNGDYAIRVKITFPSDVDYIQGGVTYGWFFVDL
jgi:hypothetical protein